MDFNAKTKVQTLILLILIPTLLLVTFALGLFLYGRLHSTIIDGFDKKLYAESTTSAAFINGSDNKELLKKPDENGHLFLQYVAPMRRIKKKADFTYLYTQIVGKTNEKDKNLTYVLDAGVGEDHSPIGQTDSLPDEEVKGAYDVQEHGTVYLSDIHPWAQWGILKSAFSPVYDNNGRIVCEYGADINVSIVRSKTTTALTQVGFVSLICILISALVAMQVARRLTQPIASVKDGALLVAAGQYGHELSIHDPYELRQLAESFNQLSVTLKNTIAELNSANADLESRRRQHELRRSLVEIVDQNQVHNCDLSNNIEAHITVCAGRIGKRGSVQNCSGYAINEQHKIVLVWTGKEFPGTDIIDIANKRAAISICASHLLSSYNDNWNAIPELLSNAFSGDIENIFMIDTAKGKVLSSMNSAGYAIIIKPDNAAGYRVTPVDMKKMAGISVPTGEMLIFGSLDITQYIKLLNTAAIGMNVSQLIYELGELTSSLTTEEIIAAVSVTQTASEAKV